MTGDEKTQPQELLEEVIGITHGDTPQFPTLEEQQEYWDQKERDEELDRRVTKEEQTCPTCDRTFKSAQAVRMHVARVHTKTILTVGQQGKKPKTLMQVLTEKPTAFDDLPREAETARRKWSLARRRAFNRKKRAQIWATKADAPSDGTNWTPAPTPKQETTTLKYCPSCGSDIRRFLE